MQTLQDRINKSAHRYCATHNALLQLDSRRDWENLYPPLTDADDRGPGKEPEEVSTSDGQYTVSWIWCSSMTAVSPDEVNEDMQVEWAQCVARADHWEEEVMLLQEEMRWVMQFLEWRSRNWLSKVDPRPDTITPAIHAGISAYAKKQGSIFHSLAIRFCQRWYLMLLSLSLPHAWATEFLNTHGAPLVNSDFRKRNRGAQGSDKLGASSLTQPLSSVAAASVPPPPSPPSHAEATDHSVQIISDSEGSTESDEFGSDTSGG